MADKHPLSSSVPSGIDVLFQQAVRQHQAGRLAAAEAGYHQVLRFAPGHAEALHRLGMVEHQTGRPGAACARLEVAARIAPGNPYLHRNLGLVLSALGRFKDAIGHFEAAVRLRPDFAAALGDLVTATNAWTARLAQSGQLAEAEAVCRHVLGMLPGNPDLLCNLGSVLGLQERAEEAEAAFRDALRQNPASALTWYNLARLQRRRGLPSQAVESGRRAISLDPALAAAHRNLGHALHDLGETAAALSCHRQAVALRRDDHAAHSNLLFCLNFDPTVTEAELTEAHRAWGAGLTVPAAPACGNGRDPGRPLRIGYVSADLGRHPVGHLLEKVLAAHDPAQVSVICYSGRARDDDVTERLKASATAWRPMRTLSDAALIDQIRADGIDILADLSGHTAGNRLPVFAARAAPVQASWIGYVHTTGLPAMDYLVMDPVTAPPESDALFTEAVVRLPDSRFCYVPPEFAPDVVPPPVRSRGLVTFGNFDNPAKLNAGVIQLWARVLQAVPGSRLVLKGRNFADPGLCARIERAFAAESIDPARLDLRGASPHADMLAEYGDVDIVLDPFPHGGGMTSFEALWMGVPVVTLPGTRPAARQTLAMLSVLGLADALAAAGPHHYVALASGLAGDPDLLANLRANLRPVMAGSVLCDGPAFTAILERAYREMWRRWCSGAAPASFTVSR